MRRALTVGVCLSLATLIVYVLALRWLFPGYYRPLVPFHADFYDYTGTAFAPLSSVLHLPRIASALAMYALGHLGLRGLMAGGIAIALGSVTLTIWLVERLLRPPLVSLFCVACCYLLLLFAHPDFYFEHRHDVPAEISYLALILALHAGLWWLRTGKRFALAASGLSCLVFALSKETFFLSAFCLALLLCVREREQLLRRGFWMLALIAAAEGISLLWTQHVQSPFLNPAAALSNPYHISFAPLSMLRNFWFYLRQLLTPAMAVFLLLLPLVLEQSRERLFAIGFVCAGLCALIPHAALPNHLVSEYAWIPAPLLFAPVLLVACAASTNWRKCTLIALAVAVTALSFAGRDGYRHRYRDPGLGWSLTQEQRTAKFQQSWPRLTNLPPGSRIVIAGLETPFLPWTSLLFSEHQFGPGKEWFVLTMPEQQDPHVPHLHFTNLRGLQLPADAAVSYAEDGHLIAFRSRSEQADIQADPSILIPELQQAKLALAAAPGNRLRLLRALDQALLWGAYDQAEHILVMADQAGWRDDEWICYMAGRLAGARSHWPLAVSRFECSVSEAPRTQAFQNALQDAKAHLQSKQ